MSRCQGLSLLTDEQLSHALDHQLIERPTMRAQVVYRERRLQHAR